MRRYFGAWPLALVFLSVTPAQSAMVFTTNDGQFFPTSSNQGWWSDTFSNLNFNDGYFTGTDVTFATPYQIRSFSTFSLTALTQPAIGATLRLVRGGSSTTNELTETLEFFDVTTDPSVLNLNQGANAGIFGDLGSGTSYGSFVVDGSGDSSEVLEFAFNAAMLAQLNSAAGGYFSLGASLVSDDGNDFLFGATNPYVAELHVQTVPEPNSVWLTILSTALFIGIPKLQRRTK